MNARIIRRVLALTGAVVLLAGCSSTTTSGNLTTSVDAYRQEIWTRTEQYTMQCMAAQGFDYKEQPYQSDADVSMVSLSPYQLTTQEAKAHGFGIVDAQLAEIDSQSNIASESGSPSDGDKPTSDAYDTALYGDGDGSGCQAESQSRAYQEVNPDDYPGIKTRQEVVQKIVADPRYDAFWASWSRCMAGKGVQAADQDSLVSDFTDRAARLVSVADPIIDPVTGELSATSPTIDVTSASALLQEERTAAVADVACLEPLRDQWDKVVGDAQN